MSDISTLSPGETQISRIVFVIRQIVERVVSRVFGYGPSVPVVGASMAADYTLGTASDVSFSLAEAGIFSGKVFTGVLITKSFDSTNNSAVAETAPNSALFVCAKGNGDNNDVVAILGDCVLAQQNGYGFGANFIARNNSGVTGSKLVGCELDVEFAAGTTAAAGTAGLYINIFTAAAAGPAIQTGGHNAGTWANGIILDGLEAAAAAGLAPNSGASMGSLVNSGVATYGQDAIVLSNTHKLRFSGTASVHGKIYMDGSNFLHVVGGTAGVAFRDSADVATVVTIADGGPITLGAGIGLKTQGPINHFAFTPIPAGGAAGSGYLLSSTANFGIFFGSNAPTLSAAKGSLYLRSDGSGVNDRMYVNTDGSTTWTAITTVA